MVGMTFICRIRSKTQHDLVAKLGLELYAQHHIGKPSEDG